MPPRKILVVMLRRIGDVILTLPAAKALKKAFPGARLDFLAEPPCQELLENNPALDRVLVYRAGWLEHPAWLARLRHEGYDWAVDFMGTPRSAMLTFATGAALRAGPGHVWHRWAYTHKLRQSEEPRYSALEKISMLRPLGIATEESDCLPRLDLRPEDRRWASEALPATSPLIGLAPASRKPTRRWPAASYAELARRLVREQGARVIVFWGPGERPLAEEVASGAGTGAFVSPATRTLGQLAALLSLCRLLVTNCNGPKHIAVALGVPTLTVHGSSDPRAWNPPDTPRNRIIRREELFCIGCRLNACPYQLECLNGLGAERVAAMASEMLAEIAHV